MGREEHLRKGELRQKESKTHTHVVHPVHRGADQVEGANTNCPHTICCQVLPIRVRLLRLGERQTRAHVDGRPHTKVSTRKEKAGRKGNMADSPNLPLRASISCHRQVH